MTRRGLGAASLVSVLVTVGTLAVLLVRQDVPSDEPADAVARPRTRRARAVRQARRSRRPGPEADACYRLAYDDAVAPTTRSKPVPCSGQVTARTFYVGTLDTVVDGHLLAVDSRRVRRQVATDCPRRFAAYVGGDRARAPAEHAVHGLVQPRPCEQSDAGQTWYRCDVIAVESEGRLATAEGTAQGCAGPRRGPGDVRHLRHGGARRRRLRAGHLRRASTPGRRSTPSTCRAGPTPASGARERRGQVQGPGPRPRRRRRSTSSGASSCPPGSSGRTGGATRSAGRPS